MSEKVLLIGGGSREHALAWKLSQSSKVKEILVTPGNGGINQMGGKVQAIDLDVKNMQDVVNWCTKNKPSLVVVGPEDPLNDGIVNHLKNAGIPCFGPSKEAAQIECSKKFSKDFMQRHNIPTASYKTFTDAGEAKRFIKSAPFKALVVKASGLAAGKGVIVAKNIEEACNACDEILDKKAFGSAGQTIVVEELLEGDEMSVLAFSDGTNVSLMPPAQDHKRAYENDQGPNTGGMGAYCPYPFMNDTLKKQVEKEVIQRAIDGLRGEGTPFVGILFAGIMLSPNGPKVLEYNCRFGDPETQSILPLLESDLYEVFLSCIQGKLGSLNVKWSSKVTCGVVVASGGYPDGQIVKGKVINGLEDVKKAGLTVFHAGTAFKNGEYSTSGGRVLTVIAIENDLKSAIAKSQLGASLIKIENSFYRKDIGCKSTQKTSGVDIDAGNELVNHIKKFAKNTNRSGVMDQIGGFGALFDLKNAGYLDPILVSGTDGVGTKLKVALECGIYDTVGIDLVAMCVNDILVQGAEPLFFLDYFACGKLDVEVAAKVISGISRGCQLARSALIGGETAEMPGLYAKDDFDLAGFAVGAVDRNALLPRMEDIKENDVVIGLPSSGVHSNGFSLVRKLFEVTGHKFNEVTPFDPNITFGELLMTPTKIYVEALLPVIKLGYIKALSHITGGGLLENIPRVMPKHLGVEMDASKWHVPQIITWMQKEGKIKEREMLKTFNCGLGMVLIVDPSSVESTLRAIKSSGEEAYVVGKVIARKEEPIIVRNFSTPMQKVARKEKKRVAVLISGSGTNLQALIDYTQNPANDSAAKIVLVISNKKNVEGVRRAERAGIPTKVIVATGELKESREKYDDEVQKHLQAASIDIVCLAGYMRIVSEKFIKQWPGKLINIHPSILPSFPGMHGYKQALDAGVRVTGCTVHFVAPDVDAGAIIAQETIPIELADTEETLQERGKNIEHKVYARSLELLAQEKIALDKNGLKVIWKL